MISLCYDVVASGSSDCCLFSFRDEHVHTASMHMLEFFASHVLGMLASSSVGPPGGYFLALLAVLTRQYFALTYVQCALRLVLV